MKRVAKSVSARRASGGRRADRTGSSLASALAEQGMLEAAEATAIKRVLAWELDKAMRSQGMTKQVLAARMSTSRSQLDRLLDPENSRIQLDTVARAARALGKRLEVRLVADK